MKSIAKKKGMTLAELTVTMGVVAIMAVLVVSFALLLRDRVSGNTAVLNAQQDRTLAESTAENWINAMTAKGYSFSVQDGSKLYAFDTNPTVAYDLQFQYGCLTGTGKSMSVRLETVESITFAIMEDDATNDVLFFITLDQGDSGSYTFCVNPHIGEVIS